MSTPHPQAEWLIAIAQGKIVQMRRKEHAEEWRTPENPLRFIGDSCVAEYEFRIKPETITINGHEVPCPVREPLGAGQGFWLADTTHTCLCAWYAWSSTTLYRSWLDLGLIHSTKEAASAHAEALLSFTRSDK